MELDQLIKHMSADCRQGFERAVATASSRSHFSVGLAHWLDQAFRSDVQIGECLKQLDVDEAALDAEIKIALEGEKTGNSGFPKISRELVRLLFEGWVLSSSELGRTEVESPHLLLALLEAEALRTSLPGMAPTLAAVDASAMRTRCASALEATASTAAGPGKRTGSALDQFTVDLTQAAREGRIDRVIGRNEEIRQMVDILCRRRQNNPILTGEAGVGKTAVVEGLAVRIVDGDVPHTLRDVSLRTLDMGLLQAGAGVKGEFENRLKGVIDDVQNAPQPVILFIDEAHTIIGAGNQAGSGDAANLLKPALARGELRTIAATTWAEYKKYFEADAALTRRFQVVKVEEPDEDTATAMLRHVAESLENHHDVVILEEAVDAAVRLSHRYISGRQLPDKCVSLLDTACARVRLSQHSTPAPLERLERATANIDKELERLERESRVGHDTAARVAELGQRRAALESEREALAHLWRQSHALVEEARDLRRAITAVDDNDTVPTPDLPERLAEIRQQLAALQAENALVSECVDAQVIAEVVADWTGVPVGRMQSDEIHRVLEIDAALARRVVGQEQAIEQIARAMRTARAGLADPQRPLGVFMLVGPSGVGKTETALALAEQLYGTERAITTINMSEFKEEHKVSLLMGSPPGYVGYGEGGVLTEAVRRKPYSVVLLDEMEKAHPGVQDVFYQVFDKGTLRDGEGRDIDFRNTVIVMTSNAASEQIDALCADPETCPDTAGLIEAIGPELRKTFKPAFLGRVALIPYYPLGDPALARIVDLQLGTVQERYQAQYGATLHVTDALRHALVERCSHADTGARQIAGLLNNELLPSLANTVLGQAAAREHVGDIELDVTASGGVQVSPVETGSEDADSTGPANTETTALQAL